MTQAQITANAKATRNQLEMDVAHWEDVAMYYRTAANQEAYANAVRALVAFDEGGVEVSLTA